MNQKNTLLKRWEKIIPNIIFCVLLSSIIMMKTAYASEILMNYSHTGFLEVNATIEKNQWKLTKLYEDDYKEYQVNESVSLQKPSSTKYGSLSFENKDVLQKLGGSIENLILIIKNVYGETLMHKPLHQVLTPLHKYSYYASLKDSNNILLFKDKFRIYENSTLIDVTPIAKNVNIEFDVENNDVNEIEVLIGSNPPVTALLNRNFSVTLQWPFNYDRFAALDCCFCGGKDFQPYLKKLNIPSLLDNKIAFSVKFTQTHPNTAIILSGNSDINEGYFRQVRDVLIDMENMLKNNGLVVMGIGENQHFKRAIDWNFEKSSINYDTFYTLEILRKAANAIPSKKDRCGNVSQKRLIYIGYPKLSKIPYDLPDLYVISPDPNPGGVMENVKKWNITTNEQGIYKTLINMFELESLSNTTNLTPNLTISQKTKNVYKPPSVDSKLKDCDLSVRDIKEKLEILSNKVESLKDQVKNANQSLNGQVQELSELESNVQNLNNNVEKLEKDVKYLINCSHASVMQMNFSPKINNQQIVDARLVEKDVLKKSEKITVFGDASLLYNEVLTVKVEISTLSNEIKIQRELQRD